MSNLNNTIRENYQLKTELDNMIRTVKENEAKHQGFKMVQYSFLMSENLNELSVKPLKYLEEIFNLDRVALFIKEGSYPMAECSLTECERVFVKKAVAFDYTFLEKRTFYGSNVLILHSSLSFPDYNEPYSYVMAPIVDSGVVTGAIGLYSKDKERFDKNQNVDFINEFALIVSIALRKLNNAIMLEMQAHTDYLTGLPNKSVLEIGAKKRLSDYRDNKRPFIFMLLDLDNFKTVNDIEGHLTGDEVLKRVALAIRDSIDVGDMLGRFGGDEFYLFADSSDRNRLLKMVFNIKNAVGAVSKDMGIPINIGISAGAVNVPEDTKEAETFMELVKLADKRLYTAKQSGKGEFIGVNNDNK